MPLTTTELLADNGPIAAAMRARLGAGAHETRPEQVRMAEAVEHALDKRDRLLVEAGTGVGKSFAYLVPAILRCIRRGEKVVIATSTIALQEQLVSKDIPLLAATIEQWSGPGGAGEPPQTQLVPILAKGRGNYLSIRRLKMAGQRAHTILPDAESHAALTAIENWAYTTQDGTLSSLPVLQRPEVWDHVRSDSDNCMGRKCPQYQQCFYQSARRELEKANLIVCNHALFFSDLALRTRHAVDVATGVQEDESSKPSKPTPGQIKAILPNYDHVIFDEAHGLEDAACEHFGLSLSMPRVMRLLRTLYSPRRRRGYLLERSLQISNAGIVDQALTLVQRCDVACTQFFEDLLEFWRASARNGTPGRLRQPDLIENPLSPVMTELAVCLRRIREGIEDENERLELGSLAKRASETAMCAQAMVSQSLGETERGDSMYAYWVEVEGDSPQPLQRGMGPGLATGDEDDHAPESGPVVGGAPAVRRRFGPRVTLACAPIEIAAILRKHLFDPGAEVAEAKIDEGTDEATVAATPSPSKTAPKRLGIILTSATLATRASKSAEPSTQAADPAFAHISRNLGVTSATTLQLGSPFDYRRQAKIVVDLTVPDPKQSRSAPNARHAGGAGPGGHASALADRILHHLRTTDAGAFVLFTSFATMHACADRLRGPFDRARWPLLVQGRDGSRQALLQRFVAEENGVLFGAASFWQGVDVRGDRLRNVIITRLPFEPPDRPLVQARTERIELTGASAFMQDSLPRAIIRFKQGFGRLIRSKSDRGQVVVLDPRIVTARYGKMFLEALPARLPVEVIDPRSGESEEVLAHDYE